MTGIWREDVSEEYQRLYPVYTAPNAERTVINLVEAPATDFIFTSAREYVSSGGDILKGSTLEVQYIKRGLKIR